MSDNITIDIIENVTNVNVSLSTTPDNFIVEAFPTSAKWGSIIGALSAQSDLWSYLSAETFSPSQLTAFLVSNTITLCSIDVKGQLLSAGTDLFNIFLTQETDSQTLSWNDVNYELSISNGNVVNLSAINTTLNSVSSLLTPLTLTNTLTGQLVTNTNFNNYQTNVANTTATLLPTTTYQSTSGTFAPKVELRQHSQFTSGDHAVQQGRNVELAFSAVATGTSITITLPRQDTNDNAQSGDELLIRLSGICTNSTVTIRQYQYTGSLPYLPTYNNIVTFNAGTPAQTIRLRLSDRVWFLISTPNLFSPSPIGSITPSTGTFTTLSASQGTINGNLTVAGNVGIGTTTPNELLTVVGNISATGITSTSAINLQTIPLSSVILTGETKTSTTSVTATDVYIKVVINGADKYLRLFDVI